MVGCLPFKCFDREVDLRFKKTKRNLHKILCSRSSLYLVKSWKIWNEFNNKKIRLDFFGHNCEILIARSTRKKWNQLRRVSNAFFDFIWPFFRLITGNYYSLTESRKNPPKQPIRLHIRVFHYDYPIQALFSTSYQSK